MRTTELAAEVMRRGSAKARLAHAALFERAAARVHGYFRRMLRDPDQAEECMQETLVLVERSMKDGTYDPERSFNAWLWLKARTVYAQWCRARGRDMARLPDEDALPGREGGQERAAERLDAARLLEEVRTQLGDETYEMFVLYYEGELTQAEVADAVGRDRKTVRARIRDAHALLERLTR